MPKTINVLVLAILLLQACALPSAPPEKPYGEGAVLLPEDQEEPNIEEAPPPPDILDEPNNESAPQPLEATEEPGIEETPQPQEAPGNHEDFEIPQHLIDGAPPPDTPQIVRFYNNNAKWIGNYSANYVYLTDGAGSIPLTLVQEGDVFLGLHVDSIKVNFDQYDDGSISYQYIGVHFNGDIKYKGSLSYMKNVDGDTTWDTIFAYPNEESYDLFPIEPGRERDLFVDLYGKNTLDKLIAEEFGGKEGKITDCVLTIKDYHIEFAYTDVTDYAELVEMIRE